MKFNQKTIKKLLSLVILSIIAIACTDQSEDFTGISSASEESSVNTETDMPMQTTSIEGTVWNLVSYNQQPILAGSEITAEFAEGRVNGKAGCNLYFADYQLDNTQLNIETIGSTKQACPDSEGLVEQETTYLNRLNEAESATVVDNILKINTPDGVLMFEAAGDSTGNQ
ncbi:MAG: META domain-containing protein [Microcoleaceae cyanobacterium]